MSTAILDKPVEPPKTSRHARRPRREGRRPGAQGQGLASMVALVVLAALFMIPVYVMVMAGLKPPSQADARFMWQLPETLDFSGMQAAWERLSPNMLNSLKIVVPATIVSSIIGAFNGFVFEKMPFRGHNVVFAAMLMGLFIPFQVVLIPLIRLLQEIGIYGTINGLILVHIIYGIPMTTLIFRNYYTQLPTELIEAGRMDGASSLQIFLRLIMPLSLPGFVVCGVIQFTNIWNDFLFGVTVVPNAEAQPVTVALNNLSGSFSVAWNQVMSGALIAALPTALVYIFLGKFFVRGFISGSVK